jgi:Leucine-rich repeat (LRR) protein
MVWPEVEQALSNRRYELILSGDKINKRLENKNELDQTIWTLTQLNFLEISQCPLIETLSEDIGKLIHLSTLTLTSNKLREIPNEIKNLENLRHLNLSNNQLKNLPKDLFLNLNSLETLNLSNNLLEELPSFSDEKNKKLAIINLSHNQLQILPDFPQQLENLSQIDLSSNQFQIFPNTLLHLNSLKIISIDSNQLTEIPCQLSQLHKLKELRFKSNPLKDNRLKKLMEQDKIKPVLEYLAKQWNDQQKTAPTTEKPVVQKQQQKTKESEQIQDKIEILHFDQPGELKGRQSLLNFI